VRGAKRLAIDAAGLQELGVELGQVDCSESLHWQAADARDDLVEDQLLVPLVRLRRNVGAGPADFKETVALSAPKR
jgi:hypothetical protein